VQFDSSLPEEVGANGLFDPGPRIVHISPERTQWLQRLVFARERSSDALVAFTTLVHELVHSASPVLDHEPGMLALAQTAGWAFWEEGLAAWYAQQFVGRLWLRSGAPPILPAAWRSYQDEVARMEWLARTVGPEVLSKSWQQSTTRGRIATANQHIRSWLRATLVQNGMVESEADALIADLRERPWEVVQRNYHLLLVQMMPASAAQFLRGAFGSTE
jgi:hypothetical protein